MAVAAKTYNYIIDLFRKSKEDDIVNVSFGQERKGDERYAHAQNYGDLSKIITQTCENGKICNLRVSGTTGVNMDFKMKLINNILLDSQGDDFVNLLNLHTKSLSINCQNPEVRLSHCRAGRVQISPSSNSVIYINNSNIGVLDLRNSKEHCSLKLVKCHISQLQVPNDLKIYSIHIMKCKFESKNIEVSYDPTFQRNFQNLPRVDRQAFSYLRNWAERNSDGFTAHVARGYELAAETHEERGFTKLMLYLWGFFGCHGLSPLRPLIWAVLLFAGMATTLFVTGTDLGQTVQGESASGWFKAMSGEGEKAQIYRSLILAFNSAINPFAVFGTRNLIVPENFSVAALMPFHGLLSLGLILLSGFSLRRRLKWV